MGWTGWPSTFFALAMSVAPDAVIGAASPPSRCHPVGPAHARAKKSNKCKKRSEKEIRAVGRQRWYELENALEEGAQAGTNVLHKTCVHHEDE